jgi:hypothetical protein
MAVWDEAGRSPLADLVHRRWLERGSAHAVGLLTSIGNRASVGRDNLCRGEGCCGFPHPAKETS